MKTFFRSLFLLTALFLSACSDKDKTVTETPDENQAQVAVLSYAVDPKFSSGDLLQQFTGTKASLEIFSEAEGVMYLTLPQTENFATTLDKLSLHPEAVKKSRLSEDKYTLLLGKYQLKRSGTYFFSIKAKDLKVDSKSTLSVPFGDIAYVVTAQELGNFLDDENIVGGKAFLPITSGKVVCNFGGRVVGKESSLTRLMAQISSGADTPAQIAQKSLNFVTANISYDHSEKEWSGAIQTIKRPNEVLMSRKGTCGSLATLYASLLAQKDIACWFAYYNGHVSVFVEGDFKSSPGAVSIIIHDKRMHEAEPTAVGFKIGVSTTNLPFDPAADWIFLQHSLTGEIINNPKR